MHAYDNKLGVKFLLSDRPIDQEEETCISYTSYGDPASNITADVSRMLLQAKWGVVCPPNCWCYYAEHTSKIELMRELDRRIVALSSLDPDGALRAAERLLTLHEEVASPPFSYGRTLYDAFQIAVLQRKTLGKARHFISRAYEVAVISLGPYSRQAADHKRLVDNMSTHRNYLLLEH